MIKLDQLRTVVFFGAITALFASSNVFAGAHEAAVDSGDTGAASSIDAEAIESTPAANRNVADMAGLVPELITTARRGEENILQVPLSISTLSADEIQAAQITDLTDVAALSPSFSFQNYFGSNLSVPTIRGVSQVDIFGDPNAPIYIDGIYVSSKSGINFAFQDVGRIEVLRGPQPAYFGYNAFSGAVNFITARPSDEPEFNTEITLGSDEKRRVSFSASGPLVSDTLSGRISGMYDEFGGTYNNANPQVEQDIGGYRYKTVSGSLFFTPTENVTAHWNLYYSDDEIDPPALGQIPANCEPELDDPSDPGSANPERLLNFCGDIPSVDENSLATIPGETGETREVIRTSLNVDWDIGVGTISSLTGYSTTEGEIWASANRGETGTTFAYQSDVPGSIPGSFVLGTFEAPLIQPSAGEDDLDDFSQEIRFTSPDDRQLRYTVGGYYRTTESSAPIGEGSGVYAPLSTLPDDIASFFLGPPGPGVPEIYEFCPCAAFGPPGSPGISAGFGGFIFDGWFAEELPGVAYYNENETDLWAGFFGVEYDFTDQVTGYFEGRYTDFEEKSITGNPSSDDPATPMIDERITKFSDDFFNWRASLEFHPNDTTTYYGSVATGVKQGGLVNFTPETVGDDPDCTGDPLNPGEGCVDNRQQQAQFGSEEITTYELGYKAAYLGGDLIVDAAIFYSDWEDIVLPSIVTSVGGKAIVPTGVSDNVGEGSITGVELSLRQQFNEKLSGTLGLSWNEADFDKGNIESFTQFPSFAPTGNMSGQSLSRQPEVQANASLTYRTQFVGQWEFYTRGDVNYQDEWFVGLPNQGVIPDRTRANLRLGLDSETFTYELWANNVFDDDTVDSAFRDVYLANAEPDGTNNFSTLFPWRLTVAHPDRRTVGLTIRAHF